MGDAEYRYLIALGSNRWHHRHGDPRRVIAAAIAALAAARITPVGTSRTEQSTPLGPSRRRYANAVVEVVSKCEPPQLLAEAKRIEAQFGRRRGQRWGARVLDLDIVLWSGGLFASGGAVAANALTIPHREFRCRRFVLGPAAQIAPRWRDPISGLTLRQLNARLTRAATLPKRAAVWGP